MRKLFFLLMIMLVSNSTFSQKADSLFVEGNNAYSEGDYKESIKHYSQVLKKGYLSKAVYFNLANAHYKLNNVAESIYFYQKAKKLDPSDKAIQNNLKYAKQMRVDEIEPIPRPEIKEFTKNTAFALSLGSWALLTIISAFLALVAFIIYFLKSKTAQKRLFFGLFVLLGSLALTSHILASTQERIISETQYAIIFPEEIKVYEEPNPKSDRLFNLHEGTMVSVESDFKGFSKIKLEDGSTGWVKSTHFKRL